MCVAGSLCCTPEINTTLWINCTSIIFKLKKKIFCDLAGKKKKKDLGFLRFQKVLTSCWYFLAAKFGPFILVVDFGKSGHFRIVGAAFRGRPCLEGAPQVWCILVPRESPRAHPQQTQHREKDLQNRSSQVIAHFMHQ